MHNIGPVLDNTVSDNAETLRKGWCGIFFYGKLIIIILIKDNIR